MANLAERVIRPTIDGDGMGSRSKRKVELTGTSPQIEALQSEILRVARSDAKVLITGESGVGKEIVSRSIHANSPRARMTFAPVNCAGLSETLLESELFGHVKGSFTGAHRDKAGQLESANHGTVLLDEIGEMTPRMQGLLLRFLETGEVQRVGDDSGARYVNVRVIGATHRNLREMVTQGAFREDLFYRLNVIQIHVPPLRERREDIPALAMQFLSKFAATHRAPVTGVAPDAMAALMAYSWPGNVRELENWMERLAVAVDGPTIELRHLPAEVPAPRPVEPGVRRERRRTVADDLYERLTQHNESFWTSVYSRFVDREITRTDVRAVIRRGLEETRGNYKMLVQLFNMEERDYKRFLAFARKHQCHIAFRDFREVNKAKVSAATDRDGGVARY